MAEETTNTGNNNTLMKVLCYFSYLWLIPFFIVKGEERNEGMITHLKQGFGTMVLCIIGNIFTHILPVVGYIALACCGILGLIGLINAIMGKDKELPILGPIFTSSFSFIK